MRLTAIAVSVGLTTVVVGAVAPAAPAAATAAAPIASTTPGGVSLTGQQIARRWHIDPGSGLAGALDAGATTTSLLDPVTGTEHVPGPSADFSITVNGTSLTSTTGWSAVTATTGTAPSDAGHPAGSVATVVLTFTRGETPADQLTITRKYRLAPDDAMVEVRTHLTAGTAPVVVTGWTVDQVTATGPAGPTTAVELHSGSSYTSRHEIVHTEPAAFDDQGEVNVDPDGVLLVDQRRAGPATRVVRTDATGTTTFSVGVEPARELGIVPVESVSGTDTDNSLANLGYPAGQSEVVAPGGVLDLGTAYTGVFHDSYGGGSAPAAAAVLQQHLARTVLVAKPVDVQQNTFHPFNDGNGMTAASMLAQASAARALGATTFILDDGWEGGPNGLAGDWRLDPVRFPDADGDGHPDVEPAIRSTGVTFGLWVEALLFNPASTVYQAHRTGPAPRPVTQPPGFRTATDSGTGTRPTPPGRHI